MAEESFMKSLFGGVVAEGVIFPYPETSRGEADELHALLEGFRRFAAKNVDSALLDREEKIAPELLTGLKSLGLFGLAIPKSHGGTGLGMTAYARAIQEVASVDANLAMTLSAHSSLGTAALLLFGSAELKARCASLRSAWSSSARRRTHR